MENINDPNQIVETDDTQPIITKPNNTYKVLFFITFIILIGTVVVSFFLIKKNKQQTISHTSDTEKLTEESAKTTSTPTLISNSIVEKDKKYEAYSLQDDVNSVSKLVLKDNQGNETVIHESKYWKLTDEANAVTAKPNYHNFIFSPDDNFLYYWRSSGWEASDSYLYNIKNKKSTDIGFSAETSGFTSDSKYFYACAEGGMMWGGVIITDLTQNKNIFSDIEDASYKCEYNDRLGEITFSKHNIVGPENIITEYIFSQGTGKLSKIK